MVNKHSTWIYEQPLIIVIERRRENYTFRISDSALNIRRIILNVDWTRRAENVLFLLSLGFIGFVIWHSLLFASFTIPTRSMVPTVKPGDKVLVDKVTTGARIFDIFDAAAGKEVTIRRTPRFRKFRRGDCLVFNFPFCGEWKHIAMDYHTYSLKRCVGVPGDTLSIRNFRYYINGKPSVGGGDPLKMEEIFPLDMENIDSLLGFRALKCDTVKHWTIRDLGPLWIPKKGEEIQLTAANYYPYRKAIEWETGKKLKRLGAEVTLDGKILKSYRFRENYYFMAGDNAADSQDSRYWGFVPEPFIVGRMLCRY